MPTKWRSERLLGEPKNTRKRLGTNSGRGERRGEEGDRGGGGGGKEGEEGGGGDRRGRGGERRGRGGGEEGEGGEEGGGGGGRGGGRGEGIQQLSYSSVRKLIRHLSFSSI